MYDQRNMLNGNAKVLLQVLSKDITISLVEKIENIITHPGLLLLPLTDSSREDMFVSY